MRLDGITSSGDGANENVRIAIDRTELTMKNRVAILAGVVWHQYANLVFSIHSDFKRLHDLLGRI